LRTIDQQPESVIAPPGEYGSSQTHAAEFPKEMRTEVGVSLSGKWRNNMKSFSGWYYEAQQAHAIF